MPPGYINNGQMISYPPVTSMHVASASNSPPFAMSNQSQYHSILQQRPLQGLHLQQTDGFNANPSKNTVKKYLYIIIKIDTYILSDLK